MKSRVCILEVLVSLFRSAGYQALFKDEVEKYKIRMQEYLSKKAGEAGPTTATSTVGSSVAVTPTVAANSTIKTTLLGSTAPSEMEGGATAKDGEILASIASSLTAMAENISVKQAPVPPVAVDGSVSAPLVVPVRENVDMPKNPAADEKPDGHPSDSGEPTAPMVTD